MIRPQIIDLLAENTDPEIFANELYIFQFGRQSRNISRQSLDHCVANSVPQRFKFCFCIALKILYV
jgi:hypothetical protein